MVQQTEKKLTVGRIPTDDYLKAGWRLPAIAPDFELEDLWAFPATWTGDDRPRLYDILNLVDLNNGSAMTRLCWAVRDLLGQIFDLGRINVGPTDEGLVIPGTTSATLADRLPADLLGTVDPHDVPEDRPFTALYETDREYVSELSNTTVHALMHLVWAPISADTSQVQMAVYVKPRGTFGHLYMGFIKPFRYLFVYRDLVRLAGEGWRRRYPSNASG